MHTYIRFVYRCLFNLVMFFVHWFFFTCLCDKYIQAFHFSDGTIQNTDMQIQLDGQRRLARIGEGLFVGHCFFIDHFDRYKKLLRFITRRVSVAVSGEENTIRFNDNMRIEDFSGWNRIVDTKLRQLSQRNFLPKSTVLATQRLECFSQSDSWKIGSNATRAYLENDELWQNLLQGKFINIFITEYDPTFVLVLSSKNSPDLYRSHIFSSLDHYFAKYIIFFCFIMPTARRNLSLYNTTANWILNRFRQK